MRNSQPLVNFLLRSIQFKHVSLFLHSRLGINFGNYFLKFWIARSEDEWPVINWVYLFCIVDFTIIVRFYSQFEVHLVVRWLILGYYFYYQNEVQIDYVIIYFMILVYWLGYTRKFLFILCVLMLDEIKKKFVIYVHLQKYICYLHSFTCYLAILFEFWIARSEDAWLVFNWV